MAAEISATLTIEPMLGLKTGEAHIIRNAGGIVTEDAMLSLVISHYLLGTQEFMIINHTDCGMLTFEYAELQERLQKTTGTAAVLLEVFHAFSHVEENVRRQIQKLRSHAWITKNVPVAGCLRCENRQTEGGGGRARGA